MRALTPWRPRRELATLQRDMEDMFDRLTERFFGPWERERPSWRAGAWAPAIESHVENGNLIVKADLPGIDPKEVTISVQGNQLTIEGGRREEKKKEEKGYFYQEVAYGKFSRTMTLPDGVEADKVKARYKDEVLEITMPAPHHYTHLVQQHCRALILREFSILARFFAPLKKSTEINYLTTCV